MTTSTNQTTQTSPHDLTALIALRKPKSRKAALYSHVAELWDLTVEERCEYCERVFGYHYCVIHTLIKNELGIRLK